MLPNLPRRQARKEEEIGEACSGELYPLSCVTRSGESFSRSRTGCFWGRGSGWGRGDEPDWPPAPPIPRSRVQSSYQHCRRCSSSS